MNLLHHWKIRKNEHGQIFVVLAILIPILIVFLALSLDFGMAYITKTTLAKSVDAAALAAIKNLSAGQTIAAQDGTAVFNANYQSLPGLGTPVVPTVANNGIVWSKDSSNNTLVTVNATATINTYFLGVLGLLGGGTSYQTLTLAASAQAIRNPLVMSLILDRSGSMSSNHGKDALPTAVEDFVAGFDEGVDNVAEISFSTLDTVDVPMTTNFQTPIDTEMGIMGFGGATFAQAGLQDGFNQILSVPPSPNIIRVAVFFTDGYANTDGLPTNVTTSTASTTHDVLNCTGTTKAPSNTPVNYGGNAPVECSGCATIFMNPTSAPSGSPFYTAVSCPNATTFPVEKPGLSNSLNINNITLDATYRTEQLAEVMRNSTNNITIYTIGLGSKINTGYLEDLANVQGADTYDSTQPIGDYEFAACDTKADCETELTSVFQIILSKILLRLTK